MGKMRVLIWGSWTPLSASSSRVVTESSTHAINNVWRFGRDPKHLTNGGRVDTVRERYIVMSLQRARISLDPRKKGMEVLYAVDQKFIRVRSIHNGVEPPCRRPLRNIQAQHEMFPYPREKSQPHLPTCHSQRSQKLCPLIAGVTDVPAIRSTEPRVGTGEPWVWGDVREDRNDKFIWEFEDCESEMG